MAATFLRGLAGRLFGGGRSAEEAPRPPDLERRLAWLLGPRAHDVLMWRDPRVTAACALALNLAIWLIERLTVRPLALAFGTLLLVVSLDGAATALGTGRRTPAVAKSKSNAAAAREQWPARATARARQWLRGACASALRLRRENPSKYCFVVCCGVGAFWFLVRTSGTLLVYAALNALFLAPYLPALQKTIDAMQSHDSDGEVEEFLPEMSTKAIEELRRAGEVHETNELASLGTVDLSLPSINDSNVLYAAAEGESSDDDEFLQTKKTDKSSTTSPSIPLTDSSDSESDFIPTVPTASKRILSKDIVYEPSHFRPEAAPVKKAAEEANPVAAAAAEGWLPFLVNAASYLKYPSPPARKDHRDSDESDEFELIDQSDL